MTSEHAVTFLHRLDHVARRLDQHARAALPVGDTEPDERTGERWDAGQVWAHMAEFPAYWIHQVNAVVNAWADEPVPFGRTKADPDRIAAIERDRYDNLAHLAERVSAGIGEIRNLLAQLPEQAWDAAGAHPTLGVMPLDRIVDEFLVGHLEEHADQLDVVAGRPTA